MRFEPGQVLYGSRAPICVKLPLPTSRVFCANTTFVLESKDPNVFLPELLPFVMQTEAFHEHSIKQSKGSVNPYVNFSDLIWYEFALPRLDEQRRFLTTLTANATMENELLNAYGSLQKLRQFLSRMLYFWSVCYGCTCESKVIDQRRSSLVSNWAIRHRTERLRLTRLKVTPLSIRLICQMDVLYLTNASMCLRLSGNGCGRIR